MTTFSLTTATKSGSSIRLAKNKYNWEDGLESSTSLGTAAVGMSPLDTFEFSGNQREDLVLSYSNGIALYGAAGLGPASSTTEVTSYDSPLLMAELEGFSSSSLISTDRTYLTHGDVLGGSGEEAVLQSSSGELSFISYDSANQQFQEVTCRSFNSNDWTLVGVGDVDLTNEKDEAIFQSDGGTVAAWKINDSGAYQSAHVIGALSDTNWKAISVADMNGDGIDDLVFAHSESRKIAYWEMDEYGRSTGGHIIGQLDPTKDWKLVNIQDLDGDSDADLLFVNPTSGEVAAWRMELGRVTERRVIDSYDPETTTIVSGHLAAFGSDLSFVSTFAPLTAGS